MKRRTDPTNIVGKDAIITEALNQSQRGMRGKIVDETKHMIIIDIPGKGVKSIKKDGVTLQINSTIIKGQHLIGKLEERIKK
jgi:RNase P/RNase MRP subunit p29